LICKEIPEFTEFTLEEFKHMRMLACSRMFEFEVEGNKVDALVPFADMLNHKRVKQTTWSYSDKHKGVTIVSSVDIKRGEEVYDTYENRCNS
jgi:histone-lysine N-methyltransferase SETD3